MLSEDEENMSKEKVSPYVIRNMLLGIVDDIRFLIHVDDDEKTIDMDENTWNSFKTSRAFLYELTNQYRFKYPELVEKR